MWYCHYLKYPAAVGWNVTSFVTTCCWSLQKWKKISVKQKKKEASSRSVSSGRHCEEITSVVLCVFKHVLKAEVQTNTPLFLLLFAQFLFLKLYKNRNINFRVFVSMQASDFCRFVSIFLRCKPELPLKKLLPSLSSGTGSGPESAGGLCRRHLGRSELGETGHRKRGYSDLQTLLQWERTRLGAGERFIIMSQP